MEVKSSSEKDEDDDVIAELDEVNKKEKRITPEAASVLKSTANTMLKKNIFQK